MRNHARRVFLRARIGQQRAQRIADHCVVFQPVRAGHGHSFRALRHIGMGADDHIRAGLRQRSGRAAQMIGDVRLVLRAPVRQDDHKVCTVHARLTDVLGHALRLHHRNHAEPVLACLLLAVPAQAVGIGEHRHLNAVYAEHRHAFPRSLRIHAGICQASRRQLADRQVKTVIVLIQRALGRQRQQVNAALTQRVENFRRSIIVAKALLPTGRRRLQRCNRQIRRRKRIAQPFEDRAEIKSVSLLRAFAHRLGRVYRASRRDMNRTRLRNGRRRRRGNRRRLWRLLRREGERRPGRLVALLGSRRIIKQPLLRQCADERARLFIQPVPHHHGQE